MADKTARRERRPYILCSGPQDQPGLAELMIAAITAEICQARRV